MKQAIRKFSVVPSFRNSCIAIGSLGSAFLATNAFCADGGIGAGAVASIGTAQSEGTDVGKAVVGVVAALCVVGIVISMVRKV